MALNMESFKRYTFIIALSILFTNCKNENKMENDVSQPEHVLVVESGENIVHPITNAISTEGGYRITKQAKNFNISEIKHRGEKAAVSYYYQSRPGFKGTETVEITSSYSIGDGNLIDSGIIILSIQVN